MNTRSRRSYGGHYQNNNYLKSSMGWLGSLSVFWPIGAS